MRSRSPSPTSRGRFLRRFRPAFEVLEDRCVPSATYSQAVLSLAPAAYYRLDEASGTTAVSQVNGGVANGTYSGTGVTYNQAGAITDDPDKSVAFNGTTGDMITGNLTTVTLAITPTVTLSVWFKFTAGNGGDLVDDLGQNANQTGYHEDDIELETNGTVNVRVWQLSAINIGAAVPGVWNNAVVIYNGATNTYQGVLNGKASAVQSGTRSPPGAQFFGLGCLDTTSMGNGSFFNGGEDEFSVFAKALSVAQIQSLYQIGLANDVQFSAAAYTARETAGNALITITRAANPALANLNLAESVTFSTSNGTAIAGTDYTAVTNFTVNFAAGQATATVMVPIINNPAVQPSRTVNLTLTQVPNSAYLFPASGTTAVLTITDSSSTISLASSPNPVPQGQAATFTATVTALGAGPPTGTVSFFNNGSLIGTATLNASGQAILTSGALGSGSNLITARYSGDSNYNGSTTALPLNEFVPVNVVATGADAGAVAQVNVYNALTQQYMYTLIPFGLAFRGGVRVAVGDLNGDGYQDIACAAGAGGGPQVTVYDGASGRVLYSFEAFSGMVTSSSTASAGGAGSSFGFTGGLFIAVGDLFGNGYSDLIVAAGSGGGPEVQVYDGKSGALVSSFNAFAPNFSGGVRVAVGDLFGNGKEEIICAAGPGGGPQISVWDGLGQTLFGSFSALSPSFKGGVYVAVGDVYGLGRAEIIAGAGAGGGPQITVFDGKSFTLLSSFYAFLPRFTGGVRVGVTEETGKASILASPGSGGGPQVVTFDASTLALLGSFFAYDPTFTGGVFVN